MEKRSSCILTGSSLSSLSTVKKCSDITIKDFTVPAGKTLDLTNLASGSTVTFQGTISFGYSEWKGPVSYTHLDVYKRQLKTLSYWLIYTKMCRAPSGINIRQHSRIKCILFLLREALLNVKTLF